jgi:hypothetical protein
MSIRCGCWAEGDATVFGEVHECSKDPELRNTKHVLPPLIPSWVFVVPPEPRYMETLDESERTGD